MILKRVFSRISTPSFISTANYSQKQVCILGSGPAGFYFAQHILKVLGDVQVDMYEKLPVPFGLVRYGVAPDHPEVKNVINTFTKTAQHKNFRFIGNVTLGENIRLKDLQEAYHAVILAYGCSEDRLLGIKGEHLKNVLSARKFVGWYNGLPSEKAFLPDLSSSTAVVLGQGNVAVDVARILLSPVDSLKTTDITSYALDTLSGSNIKTVYLVGRRGPLHVAFTIKEFREMTKLPSVMTLFKEDQFEGLQELLPSLQRPRKRLTELLLKTSQTKQSGDKTFYPLFLRKPSAIYGASSVEKVEFNVNLIEDNMKGKVVTTQILEEIHCGLVLRSIGYKGTQPDKDIPFDLKNGHVISSPGIYSTGWINSGPTGVILSTMNNAFQQASLLAEDFSTKKLDSSQSKPGYLGIQKILSEKGIVTIDFKGWEKIDKVEIERGKSAGKPREKIVDIQEMLKIGSGN